MAFDVMREINNPKNWKRTAKKGYEVYVCRPKLGSRVVNKLEGARYVTDENKQFVISGTVGETWVIDVKKLAQTYEFMDGSPITKEALKERLQSSGIIDWMHLKTRRDSLVNWAFFLPSEIRNFPVKTSWGDTLYANRDGVGHGLGDFILCSEANGRPNMSDTWVVNGEIFPNTYDMRAFPGMKRSNDNESKTPVPRSILMSKEEKLRKYVAISSWVDEGKTVFGLKNTDTNSRLVVAYDAMCFMVARGQVKNCSVETKYKEGTATVVMSGKEIPDVGRYKFK